MEHYSLDIFDKFREFEFVGLEAEIIPYVLDFQRPAGTSRGIMTEHPVWYLKISKAYDPQTFGIGEFAPLPGLSPDALTGLHKLEEVAENIFDYERLLQELDAYPAVSFALQTALLDLHNGGNRLLFPSKFTDGNELIRINGLIWMGDPQFMIDQVNEKMNQGFRCLKLKVGAMHFKQELAILRDIRETFGYEDLEIRLDANGAFHPDDVLEKLEQLAEFDIHSIEQPIRAGIWDEMADLTAASPIAIALDEELIGLHLRHEREEMLDTILPNYIILKPSLIGGFSGTQDWIEIAAERSIDWWITSALESNIGLNAIAQYTFTQQNPMPQGLGTGRIYKNNIHSPLTMEGEFLKIDTGAAWELPF